jgi:hypothetical protein
VRAPPPPKAPSNEPPTNRRCPPIDDTTDRAELPTGQSNARGNTRNTRRCMRKHTRARATRYTHARSLSHPHTGSRAAPRRRRLLHYCGTLMLPTPNAYASLIFSRSRSTPVVVGARPRSPLSPARRRRRRHNAHGARAVARLGRQPRSVCTPASDHARRRDPLDTTHVAATAEPWPRRSVENMTVLVHLDRGTAVTA